MIPERDRVPLEVQDQVVIGWRAWFLLPHDCILRSIYQDGLPWKPRQAMKAICLYKPHRPPAEGCKCGIWAVSEPKFVWEAYWIASPMRPRGVFVVGQVALWGELVEYDRGWRASHAYPKHLYAFTDDAAIAGTIRDRYLVPVECGEKSILLSQLFPKPNGWFS